METTALIGIAIFAVVFILAYALAKEREKSLKFFLPGCCFFAALAFGFLFKERLTEVTVGGVATIRTAATEAKETLHKLQQVKDRAEEIYKEIQFIALIQRASNDDRRAFDELLLIAHNSSHSFHTPAKQAIPGIVGALVSTRVWHLPDPRYPYDKLIELEYSDFSDLYYNVQTIYRLSLLAGLTGNKKIPKKEKLDFAAAVIRNDESLRAVDAARQLIEEEAKLRLDVRDVAKYLQWWKRNREHY